MNRWSFLQKNIPMYLDNPYIDEIVICDETGDDAQKIREAEFNCEKIKLHVNETRLGAFRNKEKVVRLAENKWICLMDSDNFAPLLYFQWWESYILNRDLQITDIFCPVGAFPQSNYPGHNFSDISGQIITRSNVSNMYNSFSFMGGVINIGNYIFNRDFYMSSVGYKDLVDEVLCLDVFLKNYLMLANNGNMHIVPNMQYHHIVHDQSFYVETTRHIRLDSIENRLKTLLHELK